MGDEVQTRSFTREERQQYREKVAACLDVFARMLTDPSSFDDGRLTTGMEMELNLVDGDFQPVMKNRQVLSRLSDPDYQSEIGAFNIEFNVPPAPLPGTALRDLEERLRANLNHAQEASSHLGANIVMVGILPTLLEKDLAGEWMSPSARYEALNDSMLAARGEDISIDIQGRERLQTRAGSIAPESACTSVQLHVQVAPQEFAAYWNAAQVILAPQVAAAANSPFFFGRRLWAETRTELFAQATDTRPQELRNQGVRPRVFFGDRWITSVFDLFEENVRYFPALLPELTDEDPAAVLAAGGTPMLQELRLQGGTVYRWNRPIYDVAGGTPHLRVENRVLPAGPTVVDTLANAAFYYGLLRSLTQQVRPVWSRMSFSAAHENFRAAARHGYGAGLYWPGVGECPADELILRRLLPLAEEGLATWGVDEAVRRRYLGVIEQRTVTGRNGATWQTEAVDRLEARGLSRERALTAMLQAYCEGMHSNEPVHTWELPR